MRALPETMPAAAYQRPGVVAVEERPVPRPGPGQVVLEVDHCGICGSDIHILVEGWTDKKGLVAGHEFTGTVVALGANTDSWAIGERVVHGSSPKCGHCRRCLEGKPSQCENRDHAITGEGGTDGAFARFVLVSASSLLRVPEGLSIREAALAEPLAVALHGITRSGITAGDSAMVFGAGPIGALTIAALHAQGLGPVTAVEPHDRRRALAARLGATVLEPEELTVFSRFEPEAIAQHAVHVAFECSGKKAALEAGLHQLRRGGTLVMVGAGIEAPTFDPNRIILNELTVCGSFVYDKDGFERALDLLASGKMPLDVLVEPEDVPLDRISEALSGLAQGRIAAKVMVVPQLSTQGGDA